MAPMMDLYGLSKGGMECRVQVPGNRPLHLQLVFSVNVAAQCIFDSDALWIVGGLYQGIKTLLVGHGNCDC